MKFTNAKPLILEAQKGGYAVPAFNTNGGSYDIARASLEAAQELESPLILQVYEPNCDYRGFKYFVKLAEFLCEELKITVPVALQLDHGHSFESVVSALEAGFTSVMFDASSEPLAENIKKTQQVVEAAMRYGVSVEAEVGYVKGNEPSQKRQIGRVAIPEKPLIAPVKTNVDEVLEFIKNVNVDMLAVSVGTTHGVYKHQDQIDFELLKRLHDAVDVGLVQHGTGGISLENLTRLSKSGMAKINFGEPFRYSYINYFNELTDQMEHLWHPWKIMRAVKDRLKDDMKKLIRAVGSDSKA